MRDMLCRNANDLDTSPLLDFWQPPHVAVIGLVCRVRGIWCAIWKEEMLLHSDRMRTDRIKFLLEYLVYLHIFCWLLFAGPVDVSMLNAG